MKALRLPATGRVVRFRPGAAGLLVRRESDGRYSEGLRCSVQHFDQFHGGPEAVHDAPGLCKVVIAVYAGDDFKTDTGFIHKGITEIHGWVGDLVGVAGAIHVQDDVLFVVGDPAENLIAGVQRVCEAGHGFKGMAVFRCIRRGVFLLSIQKLWIT